MVPRGFARTACFDYREVSLSWSYLLAMQVDVHAALGRLRRCCGHHPEQAVIFRRNRNGPSFPFPECGEEHMSISNHTSTAYRKKDVDSLSGRSLPFILCTVSQTYKMQSMRAMYRPGRIASIKRVISPVVPRLTTPTRILHASAGACGRNFHTT